MPAEVAIPNRPLFKAAEVCDLVKVQPYVLRSWETEFPGLGSSKGDGTARVYRRADVERVLRIKHLLLVEGLTLAGARRKLESESAPVTADEPVIEELIGQHARERLTAVRRGLRSILDMLGAAPAAPEFMLAAPPAPPRAASAAPTARGKAPRGKTTSTRTAPARTASATRARHR